MSDKSTLCVVCGSYTPYNDRVRATFHRECYDKDGQPLQVEPGANVRMGGHLFVHVGACECEPTQREMARLTEHASPLGPPCAPPTHMENDND